MEQQKSLYNFEDLISIMMRDNLSINLLFRKKNSILPKDFLELSKKYEEIKSVFLEEGEKNYFYDIMSYTKRKEYHNDLSETKFKLKNISKTMIKITTLLSLAWLSFNQALMMYKNTHQYAIFLFFLSFAFISLSMSVLINNTDELREQLIKNKIASLSELQKRKLLVLFILGERKWLGGENLIENIINDNLLYSKIKQVNDGIFNDKELKDQLIRLIKKD